VNSLVEAIWTNPRYLIRTVSRNTIESHCLGKALVTEPYKEREMDNLNSVLLEGNLVRDPDLRRVGDPERPVCRFTIGVNRYRRDDKGEVQQYTTFVDIQTWGTLAENCGKYLKKGRGVRVVGALKQETWTGKEDGKPHYRLVVSASHVEFRPDQKKADSPDEIILDAAENEPEPEEQEPEEQAL
jgi:single-strand DNA-binding protein